MAGKERSMAVCAPRVCGAVHSSLAIVLVAADAAIATAGVARAFSRVTVALAPGVMTGDSRLLVDLLR